MLYVAPDTAAASRGLSELGAEQERLISAVSRTGAQIASNRLSDKETPAAEGMDGIAKQLADSVFPAAGDQAAAIAPLPVPVAETHASLENARKSLQREGEAALTHELAAIVPSAGEGFSPLSALGLEMPVEIADDILPRISREHHAFLTERAKRDGISLAARPDFASRSVANVPDRSSPGSVYRVQLAAYRSARHAVRGVEIFLRLLGSMSVPLEVLEKQSKSAGGTVNFRIRTAGLASRNEAETLCRLLRAKGQDCLVIRHRAAVWRTIA